MSDLTGLQKDTEAELLQIAPISKYGEDQTYEYGQVEVPALLIHIMKQNMDSPKTKEIFNYLDSLTSQGWEFTGVEQKSNILQLRQYRKLK